MPAGVLPFWIHMLNGPLIFLRIQFFVFLIVIPRMCAFGSGRGVCVLSVLP